MSDYNNLKTTIDASIKQNGNQEITGSILNSVLNQMITTLGAGYQFAGVATTATDPGTPDAKDFYIANGKGTYTNFGGIEVTEDDVVVLYWDSAWHKVATGIASQAKLSELEVKSKAIQGNSSNIESILTSQEGLIINQSNIIPDKQMNLGLWKGVNLDIEVVSIDNSLSNGIRVKRNSASSGYLCCAIPKNRFADGHNYRVSVRRGGDYQVTLNLRANTDGTIGNTGTWVVVEQRMTNEGDYSYYDFTFDSSVIGASYNFIEMQFKITVAPPETHTFFEPFIGDKSGNYQYSEKKSLYDFVEPKNIFGGEFIINAYYDGANHLASADKYCCTKPYPIKVGKYIVVVNKQYFGSEASKYYIFNSLTDTDASSNATATLLTEFTRATGSNVITYGLYSFELTEDKIVAFNVGRTEYDDTSFFMVVNGIVAGDYPDSYQKYFEPFLSPLKNWGLSEKMLHQINEARIKSIWGKKIGLDGDSICIGYGAAGGYGKIISSRNGMTYINRAESGATITYGTTFDGGSNRHWICTSVENLPTDSDYILIEGGVNDVANNVPLGTLSQGFPVKGTGDTLDKTTLIGAMEYLCRDLVTIFAGKKIGFLFVHGIFNDSNYFPQWHTQYKPAMISVLNKWGVPFLDLESSVPPLNQIQSLKETYTNNGDGWHPNEFGYKVFYCDKIESWLNTL